MQNEDTIGLQCQTTMEVSCGWLMHFWLQVAIHVSQHTVEKAPRLGPRSIEETSEFGPSNFALPKRDSSKLTHLYILYLF